MRYVISYDISDDAVRTRVAEAVDDYGVRVQYSVFECSVAPAQLVLLRAALLKIIDPAHDSLRIWYLSEDDAQKTEHYGVREPLDLDGPLVF